MPLKPERRSAAEGLNRYAANASIHELAEEIGRSYGFVHRTLGPAWPSGRTRWP
ncbi:helix-turn-helix domain-containing protein [Streptomyces griseofuscus]|uniref:helix-turn-helix domain-containing protein n=1 Tax=Streptomyces griseofuscus TaxID=146922 RepID=UPI0036F6B7C4